MDKILDVDMMHKDGIKVTLGELSQSEYKRRMNSGYYMVENGQTLVDINRREKSKRVAEKIQATIKEWESRGKK